MCTDHEVVEDIKDYSDNDKAVDKSHKNAEVLHEDDDDSDILFAESIERCAPFYALYGLLDGMSVSYSTVKYVCEILANIIPVKYNDLLDTAMTQPEWLAVVISGSILITGISLIANYFDKADMDKPNVDPNRKKTSKAWEYLRDIFKGAKNGYKGVKGFVAMFYALECLSKQQFLNIVFPIGLIIGAICVINRIWNRTINDKRKTLQKNCQDAIKKVEQLNKFLQEKQDLKNRIFANQQRIDAYKTMVLLKEKIAQGKLPSKDDIPPEMVYLRQLLPKDNDSTETTLTPAQIKTWIEAIELQQELLLTAPEIQDYEEIIAQAKAAIHEAKNNGEIPDTNLNKVAHPILKKLTEEQKHLAKLKKSEDAKKVYTIKELEEALAEKQLILGDYISIQKRNDTLSLTHSLINDKNHIGALKPQLSEKLIELIDNIESDENKVFFDKIKKTHQQIEDTKEALDEIDYLDKAYKRLSKTQKKAQKEENQARAKLKKEKEKEKAKLTSELYQHYIDYGIEEKDFVNFDAKYAFANLKFHQDALSHHRDKNRLALLFSNVIGGFCDAPYLYGGILGIILVNPPSLLIVLTTAVVVFCLLTLLTRRNEELEKDLKSERVLIQSKLSKDLNDWQSAKNKFYKSYSKIIAFYKDKAKLKQQLHEIDKDDADKRKEILLELSNCYSDEVIAEKKAISRRATSELVDQYNLVQETRQKLKDNIKPSYYGAAINGIQDGLTLFGAIASIFYALDIILLIANVAFPPALIVAAFMISLVSMVSYTLYRLNFADQKRKQIEAWYHTDKTSVEAFEEDLKNGRPGYPLGMMDCNTDGFTKGENHTQGLNECFRSALSGAGKGNNMIDFTMGNFDKNSVPMTIFAFCWMVFYGTILSLRAIAKGFSKCKKEKEAPEIDIEIKKESDEMDDSISSKLHKKPSFSYLGNLHLGFFNSPSSNKDSSTAVDRISPFYVEKLAATV